MDIEAVPVCIRGTSLTWLETTGHSITKSDKLDQIGVNQTKSEIPIIKSGHFARSYIIV